MYREFIITEDGSSSIHLPEWNESYHSKHGAIREAYHVFLEKGLFHFIKKNKPEEPIKILEIGFGTGLNAFITFLEAQKNAWEIDYTGVEAYPVTMEEVEKLNYVQELPSDSNSIFHKMHAISWEKKKELIPGFWLKKEQKFFQDIVDAANFHLIYFDAFGARVQPELWTEAVFSNMFQVLKPNGILVTYSAKGSVRRAMQAVGFSLEKLHGPPGKRHMLRATKM